MSPEIVMLEEMKLVGMRLAMTFAEDRTTKLWRAFSPRRREIEDTDGADLYSVEIYPDIDFFTNFRPGVEYEKWAAVKVHGFDGLPKGMEKLIVPKGAYALFHYKGKPSDAMETFRYIYGVWLPASVYEMDDRPYFARMGEKYKGESDDSEEDFWIPIREKSGLGKPPSDPLNKSLT